MQKKQKTPQSLVSPAAFIIQIVEFFLKILKLDNGEAITQKGDR